MKPRLHLNAPLLPVLVILLVFAEIISPSKIWVMLLIGLGGAWLMGYVWARALARNLQLTREMRYDWAQVGDRLEERFTIFNYSSFPASWVEVLDHSNIPGYQPTQAISIGGRSRYRRTMEGLCTRRGLYTLGGTTLKCSDPLGIYRVEIHNPMSRTLLVMPPVVTLPTISVSPGGYGDTGRPRAQALQRTIGAAGVREYAPGDSMRLIHWPSTAKHNKFFVRQFEGMPASDAWILLDLDRSVQIGDDWNSTEEHGVILAASLTDRSVRERQAVGLVINGKDLTWLPPQKTASQRWMIFRALALAQRGDLPLAELLRRMGASFGRQSSLVIITASNRADWAEVLMPLTRRGIVPTILLLDAQSFGGAQDSGVTAELLHSVGVSCHLISRDLLNQQEARPGQQGQWQWRAGHAIHTPDNANWRSF